MSSKEIVFIRHGTTHMNEYLAKNAAFSPNFSDIFDGDKQEFYRDSPLSPLGQSQAKRLAARKPAFINECELIVTSPLSRTLQTMHLGIKPHLRDNMLVEAWPEASERLYLVSDIGRPVRELRSKYDYVDFDSGFGDVCHEKWWYRPTQEYEEWRPTGKGQRYACPGEPEKDFSERMVRLYRKLEQRPESCIAVVCHWGVIDWMLDMDFDNCQWRKVSWKDLKPKALDQVLQT